MISETRFLKQVNFFRRNLRLGEQAMHFFPIRKVENNLIQFLNYCFPERIYIAFIKWLITIFSA